MSGLRALLTQAERLARKRGQPASAHVLHALYLRGDVGPLLGEHGVTEAALLEAVPRCAAEHETLLSLTHERADKLARSLGHERATPLHVLHALVREPRCAAHALLEGMGVGLAAFEQRIVAELRAHAPSLPESSPSPSSKTSSASPPAGQGKHGGARSRDRAGRPRQLMLAHAAQHHLASETELRRARERARRGQTPVGTTAVQREASEVETKRGAQPTASAAKSTTRAAKACPVADAAASFALDPKAFPLLTALGRNLCEAVVQGLVDPVVGRDAEIERVLDVLSRRRGSSPLLVGPPGVGKTAVVEGLAHAFVRGDGAGLGARIVIELPTAALLSGTSVRGALSERVRGVLDEVTRAEGRVVLFIDEIHSVVGHDDAGGDSVASGLKTALARGELSCIGATTEAEHRRIFERDAALARRFTRIEIGEPSRDAALAILTGLSPYYEAHHGVPIRPDALRAAVDLSVRFMSERHLPDKAIALLDQAGARVQRRRGGFVDACSIAEVVAELTGVPLERLTMRDGEVLLALEAQLGARVIGQSAVVAAVSEALRKSAAGFRGNRPLGTFLFLGPTGVGKTELAKAIADLLFPGAPPTRIDMSELSEPHAVARLIGAPPGYLGHDEGGQLTEAVRKRPYQLVLLDEVEKAHRDVLLSLLPLLDEGRLTDGRGRTVDFRNTVIVMTSNLGVRTEAPRARVGFTAGRSEGELAAVTEQTLAAARAALPPELWNRIDEPLSFAPLDRAAVTAIAQGMVARVAELARAEHGIALEVEASAYDALIAAGGYDPQLGARPMRRVIGKLLEAPLARLLLSGALTHGATHGATVRARGQGDRLVFESSAGGRSELKVDEGRRGDGREEEQEAHARA